MPETVSATSASRLERTINSTRTGAWERAFPRRNYAAMRQIVRSPRRPLRTPRGCSYCIASSPSLAADHRKSGKRRHRIWSLLIFEERGEHLGPPFLELAIVLKSEL